MPDTCGNRDLLRTAGGQTFDNPCSKPWYVPDHCTASNALQWRARLDDLASMLLVAWNQLMDIENKRHAEFGDEWPQSRKFRSWHDRIEARLEALPEPSWFDTWMVPTSADLDALVAKMIGLGQDQVCLLDEMQAAVKAYGAAPVRTPFVKPRPVNTKNPLQQFAEATADNTKTATRGIIIGGVILGLAYVLQPTIMQVALTRSTRRNDK